jgi:two-component system, OmpR family, sensor histidine kinase TctE
MKKPYSIRSQLLKWLLIPMLALVVIDSTFLYHFAGNLEQKAFDRALLETSNDISQFIKVSNSKGLLGLDKDTKEMLLSDSSDKMFYAVKDINGRVLVGEEGIAGGRNLQSSSFPHEPSFYFSEINNQKIRVASLPSAIKVDGKNMDVEILVAETLNKRKQLSKQILAWILVPQLLLLLAAGVLVLVGIKRGLEPLWEVNNALATRSYRDLEPIKLTNTPREVKRLIDSANSLMSKLNQAIHSQNRFIADAAHQLRTPLAGIRAQIELTDQAQSLSEIKLRIKKISTSTERLIHLVNQFLTLAKNQPEAIHQINFEVIDLVAIVKNVTSELSANAAIKNISLKYHGAQENVMISGDKTRIHDLVYNLIDNAIKYTSSDGKVSAELYEEEGEACLIVEDNGMGIPAKELKLVFERFYRGDQSSDFGTGLGLAIVKEIATLHNATVEVVSKCGDDVEVKSRGTKFKVNFNLVTD